MLAMFQTSPASQRVQTISQLVTAGQRREFADFQALLCRHIDFDELAGWAGSRPPRCSSSAPPACFPASCTSSIPPRRRSGSAPVTTAHLPDVIGRRWTSGLYTIVDKLTDRYPLTSAHGDVRAVALDPRSADVVSILFAHGVVPTRQIYDRHIGVAGVSTIRGVAANLLPIRVPRAEQRGRKRPLRESVQALSPVMPLDRSKRL